MKTEVEDSITGFAASQKIGCETVKLALGHFASLDYLTIHVDIKTFWVRSFNPMRISLARLHGRTFGQRAFHECKQGQVLMCKGRFRAKVRPKAGF